MSKRIVVLSITLGLCVVVASQAQEIIEDLAGHPAELHPQTSQTDGWEQIEPSIVFSPVSEPPFTLNETPAVIASEVDERVAQEKLDEIFEQFAELILTYPDTKAASEAKEMLKSLRLQVNPDGKIVAEEPFYFGSVGVRR